MNNDELKELLRSVIQVEISPINKRLEKIEQKVSIIPQIQRAVMETHDGVKGLVKSVKQFFRTSKLLQSRGLIKKKRPETGQIQ